MMLRRTLRGILLAGLMAASPMLGLAAQAPDAACGTVIVPPGFGLGTPPATVDSLNPFLISSTYDGEAAGLLYDGLLWVNRGHTITWSRSIASKIDVSADSTVFTVTMRPYRWSDGVPVTAADVKYTLDLINKLGKTYAAFDTGGIPDLVKSFTVLGPEQFRVVTTHPVNPVWFELTGLSQLTPYPAHVWGKYSVNQLWQLQSTPSFYKVVDGPFRLVKFKMGQYISFAPNPDYSGHKPEIRRFIMKFLNSSGDEIDGMQSGTLDLSNLPFSLWTAAHHLKDVRVIKFSPSFGFQLIALNYSNPSVAFFHNVRVRQAMADAINQAEAIHVLFHDTTTPQYGPVPVSPPTFLSPAAKAGHYPVGYDPAKARALLDAAGWKPGPDGIREKAGRKLEFTQIIPSGGATATLWTEMEQRNFRAVGIQMNIRQVEFNQLLALLYKPLEWQVVRFGWSFGNYPDDQPQLGTDANYNQMGYSDKTMDTLLKAVTTQPGLDALYKYQDYAAEQQPIIFQNDDGVVVLARKGLKGVRASFPPTGAWAPQYLHWTTPPCGHARVAENAAR